MIPMAAIEETRDIEGTSSGISSSSITSSLDSSFGSSSTTSSSGSSSGLSYFLRNKAINPIEIKAGITDTEGIWKPGSLTGGLHIPDL